MSKNRKSVNPDMDLSKGPSAQPGPGGKVGASSSDRSGAQDINPEMDLTKSATPQPGPGGKVSPEGNRVAVNPDMDLSRAGASAEAIADEKMTSVAPTGKQDANKFEKSKASD